MNQVGPSDQIPLLVAASNGNVDLVKLLCENGADRNTKVHIRIYNTYVAMKVNEKFHHWSMYYVIVPE